MRISTILMTSAIALTLIPGLVSAKEISNAEYAEMVAANAQHQADLSQKVVATLASNQNPSYTLRGEMASPYDQGDLYRVANGFYAPGWESSFDNPAAGSGGGTSGQ